MSKTHKKRQNGRELFSRADFLKKLLDNMQIGVIISDQDGYIIYINDTYARFLNIDPAAQIGKHATEVVANTRLHIVAKTGIAEVNYPHEFKDIGFLVHRIPIREDGRIIAVLGLVLFDSAQTASRLAEKLSFLESKLRHAESELASLRSARYTFDSIVGVSKEMTILKKEARRAAGGQFPILISGDSGTGKELFAQAIHHASPRKPYPFMRINCAAIPKDLLESELFGYEKGAFTGAGAGGKPGKFELAHHGTIFLDEIGDLPLEMQPKLLRVLEEKEFERVGGTQLIRSDFRLIAATNQNLEELVTVDKFRKDLFYRLNVFRIHIPPLRERRTDIIPLANHVLLNLSQDARMGDITMSDSAQKALRKHNWPGNVRELSNVLERALSTLDGHTIDMCDLPFYLHRIKLKPRDHSHRALKSIHAQTETEAIRFALAENNYNKTRTAKMLGINRSLLYKKMSRYDIKLEPE